MRVASIVLIILAASTACQHQADEVSLNDGGSWMHMYRRTLGQMFNEQIDRGNQVIFGTIKTVVADTPRSEHLQFYFYQLDNRVAVTAQGEAGPAPEWIFAANNLGSSGSTITPGKRVMVVATRAIWDADCRGDCPAELKEVVMPMSPFFDTDDAGEVTIAGVGGSYRLVEQAKVPAALLVTVVKNALVARMPSHRAACADSRCEEACKSNAKEADACGSSGSCYYAAGCATVEMLEPADPYEPDAGVRDAGILRRQLDGSVQCSTMDGVLMPCPE